MAKQLGIVPLIGTLDGINFYMRKGKMVARKAGGGFNGTAIKKNASMARVRENNTEFGHCSRVKKVFKDSLFPFLGKKRNEELQGRLMQLFIKIKNADFVSERGKRQIGIGLEHAEGKALLDGFCFTSFCLPTEEGIYDVATTSYYLGGFVPMNLKFMDSATHFELQFGVVVLDLDSLEAALFRSEVVRVGKNDGIQDLVFPVSVGDEVRGIRIGLLYYRFSQEVNGGFYGLQEQNGFGLKVVGVS
ncbi:hypothetical protein ACI6PS_09035 [Flavobacterium sp. PLA-1-15]|uniref:hypothetical protein n=1 Tax=Flavobacterium sp. PLA-1-15 TaxID=3380533 RepID=UPI003B76396B